MATERELQLVVELKDNASRKLGGLRGKLGKIGGVVTTVASGMLAAGAAIGTAGGFAVREASNFEKLEKKFKVLLGSTELAKQRMKELEQFTLSTPFQTAEVAKSSAILQNFAGNALATGEGLRFVGDMAAFAQEPMPLLATHVGRIVDGLKSGRPFGESAMRLQELGLITGKARAKLESFQGTTMNSSEAVATLKRNVDGVNGTMKEMNNSIGGQFSNLLQSTKKKIRGLGNALAEELDITSTMRKLSSSIKNLDLTPLVNIISGAADTFQRLKDIVLSGARDIRTAIQKDLGIKSTDALRKVGRFIQDNLVRSFTFLKDTAVSIITTLTGIYSRRSDEIKRILITIGFAIEGLTTIIELTAGPAIEFLGSIIEDLIIRIDGVIGTFQGLVTGDWKGAWQSFANIAGGNIALTRQEIDGMNEDLKKQFGLTEKQVTDPWERAWNKNVETTRAKTQEMVRVSSVQMSKVVDNVNKAGQSMKLFADTVQKRANQSLSGMALLDEGMRQHFGAVERWSKQAGNSFDDFLRKNNMLQKSVKETDTTTQNNNFGGNIKGEADEGEEAISDLKNKYEELESGASDALFKLEQDHKEKLASIRSDIEETSNEISNLKDSFKQQKQDDKMSVAEQIVDTENRIAEIKKQLQGDVSGEREQRLREELKKKESAMKNNASFIRSIQSQVDEARRRSRLTEMERAIEDYKARRKLAKKEFNEKMTRLKKEKKALKEKEKEEMALYNVKHSLIAELQSSATKIHKENQKNRFEMTKETIGKEIQMYKQLAKAIAQVRGGSSAQIDRSFGNAVSQVNNISVEMPSSATTREARLQGRAAADEIIKKLKKNKKLPI